MRVQQGVTPTKMCHYFVDPLFAFFVLISRSTKILGSTSHYPSFIDCIVVLYCLSVTSTNIFERPIRDRTGLNILPFYRWVQCVFLRGTLQTFVPDVFGRTRPENNYVSTYPTLSDLPFTLLVCKMYRSRRQFFFLFFLNVPPYPLL